MKFKRSVSIILLFIAFIALPYLGRAADGVTFPTSSGLASGNLKDIISSATKWILGIFGFLAIISFVISGIMYLTASGDDDQQKKAKNQMQWSIIGVVVGLVGYIVIVAVNSLLGGSSTTF